MQAKKGTSPHAVPDREPWLKLYPPTSGQDLVQRLRKAGVKVPGPKKSQKEMEQLVLKAYEYTKPEHADYVWKLSAFEFGLVSDDMAYPTFRERLFGSFTPGEDVQPCAPWLYIMTAITLAETKSIYVPEHCRLFCIGDYAAHLGKEAFSIESDRGWYWLYHEPVHWKTMRVKPEDWVLFRPR